jgi:hypothetical protein
LRIKSASIAKATNQILAFPKTKLPWVSSVKVINFEQNQSELVAGGTIDALNNAHDSLMAKISTLAVQLSKQPNLYGAILALSLPSKSKYLKLT